MSDLKKLPYAEWLEQSLRNIIGLPIQSICLLTKTESGEVGTGYYECSSLDKLLFASYLNHDAVTDTVNGVLVESGLMDDDDEEDCEEDEEDYV